MSETLISDDDVGHVPSRRCIVRRASVPRDGLIRFVLDPDRRLVPDLEGRLPGRGMWVSADREALVKAVKGNAFARAAGGSVSTPADLDALIEQRLTRRCLDLLGLAKRGGQAIGGFDKVAEAVRAGHVAVLVTARDGAEDGRRKLVAVGRDLSLVQVLDRDELASALGRESVVHVGLAPGALAERFVVEAARLAGFRRSESGSHRADAAGDKKDASDK